MTIKDFEAQIQKEINPELTIRINPNADDIAGVYWRDAYIGVALPPQEIHEQFSAKYCDRNNAPYRSIQMALDLIGGKLKKFQDPEVYKVMTQKD